jgi:hypothetical protein
MLKDHLCNEIAAGQLKITKFDPYDFKSNLFCSTSGIN